MNETNNVKLVTLEDYKNAGVFKVMSNGFRIYDDTAYEMHGWNVDLTIYYSDFRDCEVTMITSDQFDDLCAIYIDTTSIRKKLGEDEYDKRYI